MSLFTLMESMMNTDTILEIIETFYFKISDNKCKTTFLSLALNLD
jgi:hypothetical protein